MWTIEKYKEVHARYKASGLSVEQFCMNECIMRSRFYYWLRKYRKISKEGVSMVIEHNRNNVYNPDKDNNRQHSGGFIPVWIASGTDDPVNGIVKPGEKVELPASPDRNTYMEVSYQNGTTVRLAGERDLELVKTLILLSR